MLTYFAETATVSDPATSAASYFFTQGILGVLVVILGFVCIKLYNSREQERKDNNVIVGNLQKEKEALMEARRLDVVESLNDNKSVLPGISQSLQYISGKIETVQKPVRKR